MSVRTAAVLITVALALGLGACDGDAVDEDAIEPTSIETLPTAGGLGATEAVPSETE